jgi:heme/copper-type cytochrome/quinol oxidase subunit 1
MGAVFGFFAGFYYWVEKMIGSSIHPNHLNLTISNMIGFETLGYAHFILMFLGVNITFFPMHFLGLAGMPRRIPDYPDQFAFYNAIASYGSIISVIAVLIFFYIIYLLIRDLAKPVIMYRYFN